MTTATFTAVVKHNDPWWIGWVAELPGVNAQAATRDQLLDDLRSALAEAIEMNRADARRPMSIAEIHKTE